MPSILEKIQSHEFCDGEIVTEFKLNDPATIYNFKKDGNDIYILESTESIVLTLSEYNYIFDFNNNYIAICDKTNKVILKIDSNISITEEMFFQRSLIENFSNIEYKEINFFMHIIEVIKLC